MNASNTKHFIYNKRIFYLICITIAILIGLASRRYGAYLTEFAAIHTGDMIWAMMVYFGFRFLLVNKNLFIALLLSFLFSFSIEFSQLYQSGWLNQIRDTLLGGLILGKGFLFVDLIRYSIGIFCAIFIDTLVTSYMKK